MNKLGKVKVLFFGKFFIQENDIQAINVEIYF